MSTIYASFVDAAHAERAAGALLDHGAVNEDISVVANENYNTIRGQAMEARAVDAEVDAKQGITTTTAADAAAGAVQGAAAGLGLGIVAALASVFIPGVGLVFGAGALATALAGTAATTAAGIAAGGVVGWLKDQGIDEQLVKRYSDAFYQGGAILAIAVPTGDLSESEVEAILTKYGAVNVATYNSERVLISDPSVLQPREPLVVNKPNIDPLLINDPSAVVTPVVAPQSAVVVDPVTGTETAVVAPAVATAVDPVTGVPRQVVAEPVVMPTPVAVDPVTGVRTPMPSATTTEVIEPVSSVAVPAETAVVETQTTSVDPVTGAARVTTAVTPVSGAVESASAANPPVVVDPVTGVATRTMVDPVTGVSRTVVVDPTTGQEQPTAVVAETETLVDTDGRPLAPPQVVVDQPTLVTDVDRTVVTEKDGPKLL